MGALRTYAKPERETDATPVPSTPTAEAGVHTHGRHHDPAAFLRLVSPGGTVSPSHRAGAFHNAQQHYGNRAVQRFMASTPVLQRKCACGGSCSSCMDEEETKLQRAMGQRQGAGPAGNTGDTLQEITRQRGGGQPVDSGTRTFMESRFGQDFSGVRVHTNSRANRWAQALNAHAFTTGHNIFFAPGKYAPSTNDGRKLLAHELTHVVQQRNAASLQRLAVGQVGNACEREADTVAEGVVQGKPVRVTTATPAPLVQRQACLPNVHDKPDVPNCPAGWNNTLRVEALQEAASRLGGRVEKELRTFSNPQKCDGQDRDYGSIDVARIIVTPSGDMWDVRVQVGELKTANTGDLCGGCSVATREAEGYRKEYENHTTEIIRASRLDASPEEKKDLGYRGLVLRLPFLGQKPFRSFAAELLPLSGLVITSTLVNDPKHRYGIIYGNSKGGFSYRCSPIHPSAAQTPAQQLPAGPQTVTVTFSPRSLTLPLPRGARSGKQTIRIPAALAKTTLPGLEFQQATLNLDPDLHPVDGQLTARPTLPFLRERIRELTFTVDATPQAHLDVQVPLRVGPLGEASLHFQSQEGEISARGTLTPRPRFLQNARGEVRYQDGQLSGGIAFTPEALQLPVPGLTVENVRGGIGFTDEGASGEGGATLKYRDLGQADITVRYDSRRGLTVDGPFVVSLPGIQPVPGKVQYQANKLTAQVTLAKKDFPAGLPLEGGTSVTVRLVDGQIEASVQGGIRLGRVGRGKLTFNYENGQVDLGAGIQLAIPGLNGTQMRISLRQNGLEGEADIPINAKRLPAISGNLHAWYRDGRFGGETQLNYRKGSLSGRVMVRLEQREDDSLAISGSGDVSARITPWLVGTAHVEITPEAEVNIAGEIRAPDEIPLFRPDPIRKEKTFPRVEIPLFGFSIPVIGHVGLVAFIEGGGGFTASIGPAVLRNITVLGSFSTQEEQTPAFDISGEFFMPAEAFAYLFVRGGISLGVLVAEIEGSIMLIGGLGAQAGLRVMPHIGYANGEYYFRGDWALQALAYLRLSGQAEAAIRVGVWRLKKTVWSDEWPLFNFVLPLGLNIGMKGRMEYIFGRPFSPTFEFQPDDLDPMQVVKSAIPGRGQRASSGPGTPAPPRATMRTEEVPGARATTAAASPAPAVAPRGAAPMPSRPAPQAQAGRALTRAPAPPQPIRPLAAPPRVSALTADAAAPAPARPTVAPQPPTPAPTAVTATPAPARPAVAPQPPRVPAPTAVAVPPAPAPPVMAPQPPTPAPTAVTAAPPPPTPAPLSAQEVKKLAAQKIMLGLVVSQEEVEVVDRLTFEQAFRNAGGVGPLPAGFVDPTVIATGRHMGQRSGRIWILQGHDDPQSIFHEAVHSFSIKANAREKFIQRFGSFLEEGITESLTRKHFGARAAAHPYDRHVQFVKRLSSQFGISEERLSRAYLDGDIEALTQDMQQGLGGDGALAGSFMGALRNVGTAADNLQALRDALYIMITKRLPATPVPAAGAAASAPARPVVAPPPPTLAPTVPAQTPNAWLSCVRLNAPINFKKPSRYPYPSGIGAFAARFNMQADFVNDPNRRCQCGEFEYRQWIKGRFLRMRRQDQQVHTVDHFLPGGRQLSPDNWELDGEGSLIYGMRRGQSNHDNDKYFPDRLNGCRYEGGDSPLIVIHTGDHLVGLDLEFKGEVVHIDARTGQVTVLISKTWEVVEVYIVP